MFRITRVRLHNICQHDNLDFDVLPGLTAILGRNGSGKTSALRGLAYGLTGCVDGLWGTQQTLQKDGTVDVGYAEVHFTDGENTYAVRRFSTSNVKFADTLIRNGEVVAKRRKAVDDYMATVFGMSCQLMFTVCWGRQGELAQLLTATPAVVSTFLAQVFDMRQIERIREKLKAQMDSIPMIQDPTDQVNRDKAELAALQNEGDIEHAIAECEAALEDLGKSRDELRAAVKGSITQLEFDTRMKKLETDLSASKKALKQLGQPCLDEKDCVALSLATSMRDAAQREFLRVSAQLVIAQGKRDTAAKTLKEERARAEAREQNKGAYAELVADKVDKCPLCGGSIHDKPAYVKNVNDLMGALNVDILQYEKGTADDPVTDSECLLSDAEAELKLIQDNNDAAARTLDESTKLYASCLWYEERNKAEGIKEAIERLKETPVAAHDVEEKLKTTEMQYMQTRGNLDRLKALLTATKTKRELLTRSIADGEAACEKGKTNSLARSALGEIRDMLSQSRAQARYLRSRIAAINRALDMYMKLTEMPFTVYLDENSRSFVYRTADGYEHPTMHLSGAQKSMSAVALQMALFAVMRPNMNLYLIDEPTEALDAENKLIMADMFEHLAKMLPTAEGTMLIITRDEPLAQKCGNVVEIGDDAKCS